MYVLVMMTKEGSTKIIIFMTLGAGILVLGCGHMSYSENALFLLKSSSLLPGICQINYLCSNDDQGKP